MDLKSVTQWYDIYLNESTLLQNGYHKIHHTFHFTSKMLSTAYFSIRDFFQRNKRIVLFKFIKVWNRESFTCMEPGL